MADVELTDNDSSIALDSHTVDFINVVLPDNHANELRQRAQNMFERITLPVAQGSITVLECVVCSTLVRPRAASIVSHMKFHLQQERRGEFR